MAGNVAKRAKGKWRARYRDEAGKEHSRHFDRKIDAQQWLDQVANVRRHATTGEAPSLRFDRDERWHLQPLAPRRYTSLLLPASVAAAPAAARPRPVVEVEKRPLSAYARLTGGVA